MPISREQFDDGKLEAAGLDNLQGEIYKYLRDNPKLAFSTTELLEHFNDKAQTTEDILSRCHRLAKQNLIDGFKPKHQRAYYWIYKNEVDR